MDCEKNMRMISKRMKFYQFFFRQIFGFQSLNVGHFHFRRLFTAMAGWKAGPFDAFDYFFWIPWIVPHFGGIVGAVIYELMVEVHHPEPEESNEFYITKS